MPIQMDHVAGPFISLPVFSVFGGKIEKEPSRQLKMMFSDGFWFGLYIFKVFEKSVKSKQITRTCTGKQASAFFVSHLTSTSFSVHVSASVRKETASCTYLHRLLLIGFMAFVYSVCNGQLRKTR